MSIKSLRKRFASKVVYRNLPFVYFLAFLGLLYIANVHYAEKNMSKIQQLKYDVKESRWKYMTVQSELMFESTGSQMERQLEMQEIESSAQQPEIIKVNRRVH